MYIDDWYCKDSNPKYEYKEKTKNEIKKRFPKLEPFKTYSWAEVYLDQKVTLKSLQATVNMNPENYYYYKHSSIYVHPQSNGNFNKLGSLDDRTLHCGSSNIGLAEPIQLVLISHYLICTSLLQNKPCYQNVVIMILLELLLDEISKVAVKIEKTILKEEETINRS